ncbi:MazG nucleotide pyrophosphohydrolase domain-containing protein [Pseudoclavibacter sp. RFBB5]|uniref:MazG nucleotide pyrophosphohydrolase domain-containing protein n=1 Tax=Pseudoclavibacter sp. RFBB5 TaxID=2080574 RepID=UPI000CE87CCE|nr:MazG nucleotide pyrophosphohydrolase domain-containing protein [Pseudoclavibacter sp. RFBB5]PPG29797.1 nucleoside triphosphate pyrophosphohydrolase [Pseudoclavibacter sp. RFBB5]
MADASERSGHCEHPELLRLLEVVGAFRGDGGCAWYEEQTHATLVKYLTEETAELVEALEDDNPADIKEELGDVLFQVLFHSDIASTRGSGAFTLEDVAREQADKLVRRNPHVFGPTPTRDIDEIIRLWQEAKALEKRDRTSVLDGVPRDMSALALAQKLLGKERQVAAAVSPAVAADTASVATTLDSGWGNHLGMENKPSGSEKAIPKPGVEVGAAGVDSVDSVSSVSEELELGRTLLALVRDADARGLDAERAMRLANRELEQRIRAAETRRG